MRWSCSILTVDSHAWQGRGSPSGTKKGGCPSPAGLSLAPPSHGLQAYLGLFGLPYQQAGPHAQRTIPPNQNSGFWGPNKKYLGLAAAPTPAEQGHEWQQKAKVIRSKNLLLPNPKGSPAGTLCREEGTKPGGSSSTSYNLTHR